MLKFKIEIIPWSWPLESPNIASSTLASTGLGSLFCCRVVFQSLPFVFGERTKINSHSPACWG